MENRESFMARLRPFFPPSYMRDVELAYTLSKFGHRAQVRRESGPDGEPLRYFEHVRRVALLVIDYAECPIREMVLAALLHDTIEDTRDITPELIEHAFGRDVIQIVLTLSKTPKDGYLSRFQRSTDWRAYVIKGCDRLDNLHSLKEAPLEFQRKQLLETRDRYFSLFDRMVALTPEEYKHRVSQLRDAIRGRTDRGLGEIHHTEEVAPS